MAVQPPSKPTQKQYEALGRAVDGLLVQDYIYLVGSTRKRLWRTLIQGFVAGLAGIIGATLGVALLIYILSQFQQIPGLGQVAHTITQTIKAHQVTK